MLESVTRGGKYFKGIIYYYEFGVRSTYEIEDKKKNVVLADLNMWLSEHPNAEGVLIFLDSVITEQLTQKD